MSKAKKDFIPDPKADELAGKVQTQGQEMASAMTNKIVSPTGGSPEIKEVDEPKSAINTKKAAEVVTAGSTSSGIGGLRRGAIVFSGSAGQTQGDESATTKESVPYKSGDRAGRRADPITRKLDLIDAEIIETKRYQSKPLCETSEGEGYDGNYENEHVITQKNSGGSPADPMFERSIDEISLDMLYYPNGQFNVAKDTKKLSIYSWDPDANSGSGSYDANPTEFKLGNYGTRSLTVKMKKDGDITDFAFTTYNASVPFIDEETSRLAGDAYLRDRNIREIDRNVMISKAGNESDPAWSCLGDAVINATDQNRLLPMLDSMAGNFVGLSTRKLESALSYQINKAAKDGSRITGPMSEMMNGCIPLFGYGADASVDETNGNVYWKSATAYKAGGAGLWLAINDSLPKYTSKGKLLSFPMSFKNAVAVAKSNMDPLVADQLLFDELQHNELFSTIDGPYDPLKPIVITDKAGIISPLPIDICGTGTIFNTTSKKLQDTLYVMHYENLRNKYNIKIRNFFVAGLFDWFKENASRIYDVTATTTEKNNNTELTFTIPVVSSTTSISLWDLIVCSATPKIVEERLTTLTELLKYEKNHGYPYTGKVHLKDVSIEACDNYSFSSIDEALTASIAKPVAAMKVIMPEVFWPIAMKNAEQPLSGDNGRAAYTVLPHYFVQNQFTYDRAADGDDDVRQLVLSDEGATIAYPTTRSGNMMSYFDTIYGMTEEDYKLALDKMVVYPGYQPSYPNHCKLGGTHDAVGDDHTVLDTITYKYGLTADGTPVIPYLAYMTNSSAKEEGLTVLDIIATPRELGLCQVAPAGLLSPILTASSTLNTVAPDSAYLALSGPGFKAKIYHGVGNSMNNTTLDAGSVNIDANASFRNNFVTIYATPYSSATDYGFRMKAGDGQEAIKCFVDGSYNEGTGTYNAVTGIYSDQETANSTFEVESSFRYLWTRLQRLPFVVNPFDCNGADLTQSKSSWYKINKHDIYDLLYTFGFAGYRASDYKELIYARTKERIAKGMNYVNDPFVTKSLLLK